MTASEARKQAVDFHTNETNSQFATIMDMIKTDVSNGKFETWVYNIPINSLVIDKLSELGYTVGPTQSDRNETMTKISW